MNGKAMMFAAVLVTAFSSPAPGQSAGEPAGKPAAPAYNFTRDAIARIAHNYSVTLTSENDGVIESAIAQSVRMKWALPAAQLEELRAALEKVASEGKTPAIRYKAYLAGLVYDSPTIFNTESGRSYPWDEDLFAAISDRAEKALLGYNDGNSRGN